MYQINIITYQKFDGHYENFRTTNLKNDNGIQLIWTLFFIEHPILLWIYHILFVTCHLITYFVYTNIFSNNIVYFVIFVYISN